MTNHTNWRFCTVERITNTLVLMDAEGEVLELHEIAPTKGGRRAAKRTIKEWGQHYTFEYAPAMYLI